MWRHSTALMFQMRFNELKNVVMAFGMKLSAYFTEIIYIFICLWYDGFCLGVHVKNVLYIFNYFRKRVFKCSFNFLKAFYFPVAQYFILLNLLNSDIKRSSLTRSHNSQTMSRKQ